MKKHWISCIALLLILPLLLSGCGPKPEPQPEPQPESTAPAAQDQGRLQPEWTRDAVIYEVNLRQYTPEGSFKAFAAHLPELRELGVTVLWLMPIHPISQTKRIGKLGSYYSVTDFRGVNPEFGSEEDFAALVAQAHEMGFHVMLDWVANHTGWDCPWIREHPDWYTHDESGAIIPPANTGWSDVADLNFDNEEMRTEMIACMKYWVEKYDIDGFRCDHANGVPIQFWEAARAELETVKPLYMLAEDNRIKEFLNYAFDFNYNWGLYDTLIAVAKGTKNAGTVKLYIPDNYPDGAYTLNFLDNHDKNSYENTIAGAYGYDALPSLFSLIYTIPGAPLLYTGDEIGLDHALAFMDRDPVDWNSTEQNYRPLLSLLARLRSEHPALWCGNYGGAINWIDAGNKSILAFSREKNGDKIICLFNLSKKEQPAQLPAMFGSGAQVLVCGQGAQTLKLEPYPAAGEKLEGERTLQPWEFWVITEGSGK